MEPRPTTVIFDDPLVARLAPQPVAPIQYVQYCRWADSGFPVGWPVWLDSSGFEWACRRESLRMLPDPRACLTCARWEPRSRRD